MKRKIGFIALTFGIIAFIFYMFSLTRMNFSSSISLLLIYAACMITAIICLIGDVIRFIGKCFSQGFSAGNSQECSQVCPLCGKAISGNARFCGECGCELTKNS